MDKSKMKEIRRHVRQTDLAEQSTQPHCIGPDGVEHNKGMTEMHAAKMAIPEKDVKSPTTDDIIAYNRKQDSQLKEYNESCMNEHYKVRREVLNELWTTDKILKDGFWYIKLTDVIKIIGDYNNDMLRPEREIAHSKHYYDTERNKGKESS